MTNQHDQSISRSRSFFTEGHVAGFTHRAFTKAMGYDDDDMQRPLIGICNTYSELNNCNSHLNQLAEAVKRGVWQAGGFPLEFPTISLGEIYLNPTSMLYRNLAAIDTEEMIRAQPLDGVVLLVNCDKTVPAAIMGACSADVPTIVVSGGPALNGHFRGEMVGACTDCRRLTMEYTAGAISAETYRAAEDAVFRGPGHCMVMGTASTMNSLTEALGIALPGNGATPAVDGDRVRIAERSGRRIVDLAREGVRPSHILTVEAFENAITLLCAVGGSTNAVVHLPAIAGRLNIDLPLDLFDRISRRTPIIASLRPSGAYQMEDLHYAGGVPAVLKQLLPLLHGDAHDRDRRNAGRKRGPRRDPEPGRDSPPRRPAAPRRRPRHPARQSLPGRRRHQTFRRLRRAPQPPRPRRRLHRRRRPARPHRRPGPWTSASTTCSCCRTAVLSAVPACPKSATCPSPRSSCSSGVRDMVRISDARMSGTAFGAIVLHVSPESAVGGPLALVRDGDEIELDFDNRSLTLHVDDAELARRRADWQPPAPVYQRGYGALYEQHVTQAPQGADFDFLQGNDPVSVTIQPKF